VPIRMEILISHQPLWTIGDKQFGIFYWCKILCQAKQSNFFITLPENCTRGTVHFNPGMILVVDDNQENLFSLRTLLGLHNFTVDTASSGEEALKKILQHSYSLIILDVQMPDMDGFEVAEATSGYSKSKDIPIIFLSAVNTHKKFITKGYQSGGIDYITKPFDPEILLLKVKTFYKLSEQTRQLNNLEVSLREEIEFRKEAEQVLEKRVTERTRELMDSNRQLERRTEELKTTNQRLAQSNNELQQFAYIASHDMQEPLRKIQTFSAIILNRHTEDRSQLEFYLNKISLSATRLRTLVSDLLAYSGIQTEFKFVKTDLNKLMHECLEDLEIRLHDQACDIVLGALPEIDVIPSQIKQVFQNLLSNALKFSRKDRRCKIQIRADFVTEKRTDAEALSDGPFCRISISDNGIGFDPQFAHTIFEIFQRLNSREVYEGTGIGLSIVKKIVENHGGIISASGAENEGATFTIVLPVKHNPAL